MSRSTSQAAAPPSLVTCHFSQAKKTLVRKQSLPSLRRMGHCPMKNTWHHGGWEENVLPPRAAARAPQAPHRRSRTTTDKVQSSLNALMRQRHAAVARRGRRCRRRRQRADNPQQHIHATDGRGICHLPDTCDVYVAHHTARNGDCVFAALARVAADRPVTRDAALNMRCAIAAAVESRQPTSATPTWPTEEGGSGGAWLRGGVIAAATSSDGNPA